MDIEDDPGDAPAYARLDPQAAEQPPMASYVMAVPEHSGAGESQSNGGGGRAVQMVEGQARTPRAHLQDLIGCGVPCTHPLMRWLVAPAAFLLTKHRVGDGRLTPYI